ncbi:MAG: CDGSH iron-sulfur domain-containing protein [Alphaproteobacteria bacterium]
MAEPVPAQKAPYAVDVEAGRTYYWCACGRSKKQPYCDGAHKEVGLQPLAFTPDKTQKVYLCGCKASAKKPYCDGTHSRI